MESNGRPLRLGAYDIKMLRPQATLKNKRTSTLRLANESLPEVHIGLFGGKLRRLNLVKLNPTGFDSNWDGEVIPAQLFARSSVTFLSFIPIGTLCTYRASNRRHSGEARRRRRVHRLRLESGVE